MNRRTLALAITVIALSGCANPPASDALYPLAEAERANGTPNRLLVEGTRLLASGDAIGARQRLAEATAQDVTDPLRQTLLALSYHADADKGTDSLRLARVGYEAALKSAPGDFWAGALAGQAAFELGDYRDATEHFARVALYHPHQPEPFAALAVAAYQSGDLPLALMAAARAEALSQRSAPTRPDRVLVSALRVSALAHAAEGDGQGMQQAMGRLAQVEPRAATELASRSEQLLSTAAIDQQDEPAPDEANDQTDDSDESDDGDTAQETKGTAPSPNTAPEGQQASKQISVDVVILLAQHENIDRVGINLLDGLKLQFGGSDTRRDVRTTDGSSFERTITRAITLPDLTYNLNIFNRLGSYYEVAARPSLTAHLGDQSEFFVGKSLRVAVKGVNDSSLEKVDVGIELKAKPLEIDDNGAKLKISAERSFLQDQPVGSFAEGLSTFRQFVSATARVKFGETLVLSGLSENVTDSTGSKTPLIGDLPLIGRAFNQRTTAKRRDAVLILVTPSRPTEFASQPWARSSAVQQLVDLWDKVVDPSTNAASVTASLARARLFSRMQKGDVALAWPAVDRDAGSLGLQILNLDSH